MNKKLSSLVFVLVFVGSAPLAQADAINDMDDLSPERCQQAISAEIDDTFDLCDNDFDCASDEGLTEAILYALGDVGDDNSEADLDLAELEAEMREARTTVRAVVSQAVGEASQSSYRQESPASPIVLASSTGNMPRNAGLRLLLQSRNRRVARATSQTGQRLAANIRSGR